MIAFLVGCYLYACVSYYLAYRIKKGIEDKIPSLVTEITARVSNLCGFTFYITSIMMLLSSLECSYIGNYTLAHFSPSVPCWGVPNAFLSVLSIIMLPIAFALGFVSVLQQSKYSPKSRMYMRTHLSNMQPRALLLKTLICLIMVILQSYPFYQSVLVVFLSYKLFLDHYQMLPFKKLPLNILRGSFLLIYTWSTLLIVPLNFIGNDSNDIIFWILIGSFLPVGIFGGYVVNAKIKALNGLSVSISHSHIGILYI